MTSSFTRIIIVLPAAKRAGYPFRAAETRVLLSPTLFLTFIMSPVIEQICRTTPTSRSVKIKISMVSKCWRKCAQPAV